jgi:putative SOS response-associated peptidase YedK
MCGRFILSGSTDIVGTMFRVNVESLSAAMEYVSITQSIAIIRSVAGECELAMLWWVA